MGRKNKKRLKLQSERAKEITKDLVAAPSLENAEQDLFLKAVKGDMRFENSMREALDLPNDTAQVSEQDTMVRNLRGYLISNNRYLLSQFYCEIGIAQSLIDVPVDDAYRGGIEIQSKQLDEGQIAELLQEMIEKEDLVISAQTAKWNRLFGGAATIVMTDQDPNEPLDIAALKEGDMLEFKDADLWELFFAQANVEQNTSIMPDWNVEYFDYYGIHIHRSRVLLRKGIRAPSFVRPRLRGWGLSSLEPLVRSVNQYLKTVDLTFEVLDEFKVDVYKIKNFAASMMNPQGVQAVRERVQLANMEKNFNNAITMDSEDEYAQKQVSFTGLAEVMKENRMQIAADTRMPISKIFGIASSGFSSGEDDIENYNAVVESLREKEMHPLLTMVKLRCQVKFGFVPQDLKINFLPLRILSSEQEENVKTQKFNRLSTAQNAGTITMEEYRDGVNRDNLLPVQLDPTLTEEDLGGGPSDENEEKAKPVAGKKPATQAKEAKEAKS